MGPWANRLDEQAFYANGKRYPFDMALGNVRGDIPIHGFVTTTDQWQVVEAKADGTSAWVTSRLEFYKQPAWMKQWPFAHTVDMTYRLQDGVLEVRTDVDNLSAEPMPVAIGFHPYFQLTDSHAGRLDDLGRPRRRTGCWRRTRCRPARPSRSSSSCPIRRRLSLRDYDLDDVFSDLVRDAQGRATMTVKGKQQKLDVMFGPNYKVAVVWAPKPPAGQERNFICFEPMVGDDQRRQHGAEGTTTSCSRLRPARRGKRAGGSDRAASRRPLPRRSESVWKLVEREPMSHR